MAAAGASSATLAAAAPTETSEPLLLLFTSPRGGSCTPLHPSLAAEDATSCNSTASLPQPTAPSLLGSLMIPMLEQCRFCTLQRHLKVPARLLAISSITAPALPHWAHALPWKSRKPCRGRRGIFDSALVLCITFRLLLWGAPRHALVLDLGTPAIF